MKPQDKRKARIIALKGIYAYEMEGSNLDDTFEYMLNDTSNSMAVINYGRKLSDLVLKNTVKIDSLIKDRSKNWDFNRIASIDKLILRISLVEMIYVEDIPLKVSIAEGVEIAKEFSTNDSSSFINGILDAVYNQKVKEETL